MADSSQEKTEQATSKRLEDASAEGQVPYSKELTAALMFLAVMATLYLEGGALTGGLGDLMLRTGSFQDRGRITADGVVGFLSEMVEETLDLVVPLFIAVVLTVLLTGYLQVGFSVNFKRVSLRWGKLNPAKGFSRIFSSRSLMTVGQSVLKLMIVGVVVWTTVADFVPRAAALSDTGTMALARLFLEAVFAIGFKVGALILILGIIDVFWQRYRHGKDLMMTKEEVKEERKQSEGDPKIKSRIRNLQREAARARMMQDVKKATVVVRNPTHYAVALRYESGRDPSPRVVAKGKNLIAIRIIQIAENAGVPVRSDPPLARRLHATVRLGQVIPEELFQAVAKVLAWVYRRRERRAGS